MLTLIGGILTAKCIVSSPGEADLMNRTDDHSFVTHDRDPRRLLRELDEILNQRGLIILITLSQEGVPITFVVSRMQDPVINQGGKIIAVFYLRCTRPIAKKFPGQLLLRHDAAERIENNGATKMQRFGARRGPAPGHDEITHLHELMHHIGVTFDVHRQIRVLGAPMHQLVIRLLVSPANRDHLQVGTMPQQFGQHHKMIMGSVSSGR